MELYIKNISDITYLAELIPPFWADLTSETTAKRAGLIHAYNLLTPSVFVSYAFIKKSLTKR